MHRESDAAVTLLSDAAAGATAEQLATQPARFTRPTGTPSNDGSTGFDEYGYPTQKTLWTRAEAVNAFQFKQPISIGDVVSFYTRIEKVGRTSITVHVSVEAITQNA